MAGHRRYGGERGHLIMMKCRHAGVKIDSSQPEQLKAPSRINEATNVILFQYATIY